MNILRSATSVIIVFVFVTAAAGVPVQDTAKDTSDIECPCENIFGANEDENGACVCEQEDYFIDSGCSHCIPVLYGGYTTACNETLQCFDRMKAGAICSEGVCACATGYHYLHGRCWRSKNYGDTCEKDEECYAFHESDAYVCNLGICACAVDAYRHRTEGNYLCRRIARENEECESTMDCEGNDLICMQVNGKEYVCQKKVKVEDEGVDFIGVEEVFASKETTGDESTKETNCKSNEEESPSGKCICTPGYFRKSATADCLPELGTSCVLHENRTTEEPHIEEAICRRSAKFKYSESNTEGVWSCLGGFLPNVNNRECIGMRSVGISCPMGDVHCAYYGAKCESKVCRCPSGFHFAAEKFVCWPTKGLNEACSEDADCGVTTENSTLCNFEQDYNGQERTGICKCKDNYHEAGSDCRPDAKALGDVCTETSDCTFAKDDPKVTCTSKKCRCKTGNFQVDSTTCLVGVGGDCTSNSDCKNVDDSNCSENKCICDSGFVRNNSSSCLPVANEYGGGCQEDVQCNSTTNPEYMECTKSMCLCKTNYHFVDNFCWDTKKLDAKCTHPNQCIVENSLCLNSFCTCNFGYIQNEDTCSDNAAQIVWPASPISVLVLIICVCILR